MTAVVLLHVALRRIIVQKNDPAKVAGAKGKVVTVAEHDLAQV